jgi:imidazolonepropionase-like amidohydrolase
VAQYYNETQTAGSIAVGKRADVVLLDADPLLDISHMTRLQAVWTAGYPLHKAEIDTRLQQIRVKYQNPE